MTLDPAAQEELPRTSSRLPLGLVALQSAQAVAQTALARLGLDRRRSPAIDPRAHPAAAGSRRFTRRAPRRSSRATRSTPGRRSARARDRRGPLPGRRRGGLRSDERPAVRRRAGPRHRRLLRRARLVARRARRRRPIRALCSAAAEGMVGALRVEFIAWDRVWMRGPRGLCQAAMFAPSSPSPRRRRIARPSSSAGPPLAPWISQGIETISPTEHAIDRGLVPRIVEKLGGPPRRRAGRPGAGRGEGRRRPRLNGVRAGSLLGALGVVNGDRLETINGYELTSTQAAMEAYAQLQSADRLTLQVNRGGSEAAARARHPLKSLKCPSRSTVAYHRTPHGRSPGEQADTPARSERSGSRRTREQGLRERAHRVERGGASRLPRRDVRTRRALHLRAKGGARSPEARPARSRARRHRRGGWRDAPHRDGRPEPQPARATERYERLEQLHAERFKGEKLPIDAASYDALRKKLEQFFERQGITTVSSTSRTQLTSPPPSGKRRGGASRRSACSSSSERSSSSAAILLLPVRSVAPRASSPSGSSGASRRSWASSRTSGSRRGRRATRATSSPRSSRRGGRSSSRAPTRGGA